MWIASQLNQCRSSSEATHTWEMHIKLASNFIGIFIYNTKF